MSGRVLTFFDQSLVDGEGKGQPGAGAGLDQAGQDIDGSAAIGALFALPLFAAAISH